MELVFGKRIAQKLMHSHNFGSLIESLPLPVPPFQFFRLRSFSGCEINCTAKRVEHANVVAESGNMI